MFKDKVKAKNQGMTFEEELELKLKTLKSETSNNKNQKKQMAALIEETVHELKGNDIFGNLLPAHSIQKQESNHYQQPQLDLKEDSLPANQERNIVNLRSNKKKKMEEFDNHISNLVSKPELVDLLKTTFKDYRENQEIALFDFIERVLSYLIGISIEDQEIYEIKDAIKNELTTTDPEIVSLNALQILSKKVPIQNYLLQSYIDAKVKIKLEQMSRKNKRILEGVTSKIDSLSQREQELGFAQTQIEKRELAFKAKQKALAVRQKQYMQREKEFRRTFEEKCKQISESYLLQIGDAVKEMEKRLTQLEKNVKNKMELIERRAENLKFLIKEQKQSKTKKTIGESEAKIKLKKLEKQFETMQRKYKGQLQQFKNEETQFLKTVAVYEEKAVKNEKKYKKQKQKADSLQSQLIELKERNKKIEEEYAEVQQVFRDLKSRIPEQNVIRQLKAKDPTSRSNKTKRKKEIQDTCLLILLYEKVLSFEVCFQDKLLLNKNEDVLSLMKEMLPLIIGRLCSEDDDEEKKPHFLVIKLTQLVILSQNESMKTLRIWSNQLCELLKMSFSSLTSRSLFLFLLPLLQWSHKSASKFFTVSIQSLISDIQQRKIVVSRPHLFQQLQQILLSPKFLLYLNKQFVFSLKQILLSCESKDKLEISLQLSSSSVDFLVTVSSHGQLINNLINRELFFTLVDSFEILTKSVICIYNAETKSQRKRNQTIFQCFEQLEQLSEKVSILIQRIIYQTESRELLQKSQTKTLLSIYKQLSEINKLNGMNNNMILANLKSTLSLVGESL